MTASAEQNFRNISHIDGNTADRLDIRMIDNMANQNSVFSEFIMPFAAGLRQFRKNLQAPCEVLGLDVVFCSNQRAH